MAFKDMLAAVCCFGAIAAAGCGGGGGGAGAPSVPVVNPTRPPVSTATASPLNLPAVLFNYANPPLPPYYTSAARQDNTPADDPVTNAGATLGRVLFWDTSLSINDTVACGVCHAQANGFTANTQFSQGVAGFTTLHAMRLANVRYYGPGTMFWDKSAASVEAQPLVPIQSTVEMGWDSAHGGLTALEAKLAQLSYYPPLFTQAFGDPAVTTTRMTDAIAQFERSIISTGSRWDQGYALVYSPNAPQQNLDADLPNFTAQENRGRHLFMAPIASGGANCAACHQPPTYALIGNSLTNGLDAGQTEVFKAPSLKNVGVTGPYMHDGRFATLADVVTFYNSGIQAGPELDPRLQQSGQPIRLNLSASDQAAIVAFLQTLTDPTVLNGGPWSTPFNQ